MTHLTFEEISELAERGGAFEDDAHLAQCAQCRETLQRVRALLDATRELPRDIAPPAEVWSTLRLRLSRERAFSEKRWWHNGWLATAAAILLVAGTAIITSNVAPRAKARVVSPSAVVATPNVVRAVDMNYAATVESLRETLDSQRNSLAPGTVQTVDRALAVIDSAIAEARAALASDPANAALIDILSAHYQRKVDLLQRATELSTL